MISMDYIKFIKQGTSFPRKYIEGRFTKTLGNVEYLKPREGIVISEGSKKTALYKKENGEVIKLSPICTHLGCVVGWDSINKNWECPCHKSRFNPDGSVLNGPARKNLTQL